MFAWLPAQHLQRLPAGGLGEVLPEQWFTSGCSEARARWLPDGSIETDTGVQELILPKDVHQWTGLIKSASAKAGAPAQLVAGIMATESGGQPQAKSYCCYGLMGFLPATASWVAGRTVTPQELLSNTTLNVELGAKLIRTLLDKYGNNPIKVALSYNAGSVKCGAPKACPDAPNQWNAITDCAQGKAVDYPARMFGYSNAWHKLYGKMNLNTIVPSNMFGPSFYIELALKTAAVVGVGYLAYKGLSEGKLFENPFAASRCCECGGPIVSHARRFPIWMHDNSGGWYAGREIDHDACGPDELLSNPSWKVGDIVRSKYGDWALWRIDQTFEADSPYVFGVLVSSHKFHKAGTEKRMIPKKDYKLEESPAQFARAHLFEFHPDVKLSPKAEWR